MTYERPPTSNQCAICGQPATCSTLKDPWGKSDEMEGRCAKHSPKLRDPDDVALIDRQRAEIERLQSRLGKIYWATTTNPDGLGLGDIQNICRPFSETHDPYADQNRALVAEIAARRGITLGHLREDGGCELAQIMRRLDAADAEVERLRSAPHCPTCGCWR